MVCGPHRENLQRTWFSDLRSRTHGSFPQFWISHPPYLGGAGAPRHNMLWVGPMTAYNTVGFGSAAAPIFR